MKILGLVLLIILGLLIGKSILQYIDNKYFEGFWFYILTHKKVNNSILDLKYQKYLLLRDVASNTFFILIILGCICQPIYWKIKMRNKK